MVLQEQKSCVCLRQNTHDAAKDPLSLCGETPNKHESPCLTRDGCGNGVRLFMSLNHGEVWRRSEGNLDHSVESR